MLDRHHLWHAPLQFLTDSHTQLESKLSASMFVLHHFRYFWFFPYFCKNSCPFSACRSQNVSTSFNTTVNSFVQKHEKRNQRFGSSLAKCVLRKVKHAETDHCCVYHLVIRKLCKSHHVQTFSLAHTQGTQGFWRGPQKRTLLCPLAPLTKK